MKIELPHAQNAPANCLSDYGVMLGEEAVPFVVAYDLGASPQPAILTDEEAAAVGMALLHSLVGNRRRGDFPGGGASSLWASEARADMTRQRR